MLKRLSILSFLMLAFLLKGYADEALRNCEITGTVRDSLNNEGLPFASVQLFSDGGDKLVAGGITDMQGKFSIKGIAEGRYQIAATYMGYSTKNANITISKKKEKIDFVLSPKEYALSEVAVEAEKMEMERSIEKSVVNISKMETLAGGTATEVMQSLPSVDVDINGAISYRGSNKVTILLNGKKSELVKSLDQIPAGQIERIELINNPSAKYEADGMAGIINIVTKKGQTGKTKTSLQIKAGHPETLGANVGVSGPLKKASYFVRGGINHQTKFQTKEHWRKNYENLDAYDYYQFDRQDETRNNALISAGLQVPISDKQQIGFSVLGSKKFNNADRHITYLTQTKDWETEHEILKDLDIDLDNYTLDANLDYSYDFVKGRALQANLNYSFLDQSHSMNNRYHSDTDDAEDKQETLSEQLNKLGSVSLDYVHPISDSLSFEAGYSFSSKDLTNDFSSQRFDPVACDWFDETDLANEFNFVQQINALYLSAKLKFSWFDVQAGLRGEYTQNSLNETDDDYADLFPSITISRKLGQHWTAFAGFNRRINRPTIKMLNPFTDEYADILNMHHGNPELKPEYVNSYELGTRAVFERVSAFASVYYRNIDQAISRIKSASNDSAFMVTFMNLDRAHQRGAELSLSLKAFKWWSINAACNVFNTKMIGQYGLNDIDKGKTAWNLNLSSKIKLPAAFTFQVMSFYRSPLPSVEGTYMHRYQTDMAVAKKIMKGKGKLVFKVSDVFNTYRYGLDLVGMDENGYYYSQKNRRKNESQYFILSFVYNFDGKEKQKKKAKFFLDEFAK